MLSDLHVGKLLVLYGRYSCGGVEDDAIFNSELSQGPPAMKRDASGASQAR